jgi:hypothetical protein
MRHGHEPRTSDSIPRLAEFASLNILLSIQWDLGDQVRVSYVDPRAALSSLESLRQLCPRQLSLSMLIEMRLNHAWVAFARFASSRSGRAGPQRFFATSVLLLVVCIGQHLLQDILVSLAPMLEPSPVSIFANSDRPTEPLALLSRIISVLVPIRPGLPEACPTADGF